MTSHELAKKFKAVGEYLESKTEFPIPNYSDGKVSLWYMFESNKANFLEAVRALGSGKKLNDADYVHFIPNDAPEGFEIKIDRSAVCTIIKPAEYDCTPLLEQIEEMESAS